MADTASRKSMHLQPVMLIPGSVPDAERFSEFSHRTGRSHKSAIPPPPTVYHPNTFNNFQL
mgnify:CR=1 FL=1